MSNTVLVEITSTSIFVATAFESFLNILNVFACSYLIFKIRKTRLMHVNLKTMLISLSSTLILFNTFRFIKSFGYFMLQETTKSIGTQKFVDELKINLYNRFCVMNRFFYDSTVNVLSLTMLGLILERIAATCFVKVYEKTDSALVARIIVFFQWICGISVALNFLFIDQFDQNYWNSKIPLVTCSFVYTHPEIVLTVFTLSVTLFCSFTAISIFLYYFNRQKFQAAMNRKLTIRYQYKENVTTLKFLVPMLTTFGLSNIISALLIIYMFINITENGVSIELVDYLWKIEKAYNATVSVYTIFFVGIFIKLHRPIWDKFVQDLKWVFGVHQRSIPIQNKSSRVRLVGRDGKLVEAATEGDVYFKSLKETWS